MTYPSPTHALDMISTLRRDLAAARDITDPTPYKIQWNVPRNGAWTVQLILQSKWYDETWFDKKLSRFEQIGFRWDIMSSKPMLRKLWCVACARLGAGSAGAARPSWGAWSARAPAGPPSGGGCARGARTRACAQGTSCHQPITACGVSGSLEKGENLG